MLRAENWAAYKVPRNISCPRMWFKVRYAVIEWSKSERWAEILLRTKYPSEFEQMDENERERTSSLLAIVF